ncbi:hypothetical protein QYE76_020785 [Lolium multiflorum]|uniref:Uncharacterized protein n=1 Tax=Lolium multiflorum TaxID=4521 RepID=A0AAD8R9J8_LOLMU|nr:hypothetical protein QYE76_020785 [Lolium multiflorum]
MVGRGRPPLPPQVARDEGIRPRRRNMEDEENMYGKLKFNMPKFKGEDDAEAYLSWALKVDKIFRIHNYSGAKKVAMASLEFEDYANTWWEQVVTLREEKGDPPIDTWEDMKEEMQARFVPTHYKTDLFNKLQKLKQGTKTVEEFFKEMELTMMRANIQESENQTIARFFIGLNYPIKRIVEFQQYSNMVELVHQASKAERQVNEDIKYSKSKQYFASKLATSIPTTSVKPSASSTPSKQPSIQSRMKQTVSSTASSKASTGPSNVTCFKCGTQGHKSFECKNTKVMITMENGDIETLSEGEYEALVQAAVANEEDYDEESGEDPLLCTHDPSPSLVVTRVLTTQPQAMEDQRCNIFQTRAGIGGKSIKVIIDGGSCHNLASTELCEKLNLPLRKHPHPYHVQWLSDKGNVKIQHTVTVNFKIGPYEDTVECDVVPMTVCHMLLGRPWQFDKKAIHDGFSNAYTFKEFQDVFPDELPHGLPPLRGIEHRIDLIPGAPLPNRAAYRTNPEDTKEIQRQIQDLLAKGEVVRLHGIPASIVSDRDVKFMSYLWKSLMAKFGVKLLFSSSSHPQTDGQTEVVNRSLSTLLRTLVKTNLKSWEDCLPHAEFAYNRAKHSTTARSPFMVVYGFEPPTALDILPLPLHERTNMDFDERTTAMKKLHEETRATIQEHVLRQANRLNAKKKERVFEEGDLVWIHLRKERFPQERNSKLKPRGDGPFKVLKRINNNAYVIDIPTSKYLVSKKAGKQPMASAEDQAKWTSKDRFAAKRLRVVADELNPEKRAVVEQKSAFSSLLNVAPFNIPNELIDYVAQHITPSLREFRVGKKRIVFTRDMITKVPDRYKHLHEKHKTLFAAELDIANKNYTAGVKRMQSQRMAALLCDVDVASQTQEGPSVTFQGGSSMHGDVNTDAGEDGSADDDEQSDKEDSSDEDVNEKETKGADIAVDDPEEDGSTDDDDDDIPTDCSEDCDFVLAARDCDVPSRRAAPDVPQPAIIRDSSCPCEDAREHQSVDSHPGTPEWEDFNKIADSTPGAVDGSAVGNPAACSAADVSAAMKDVDFGLAAKLPAPKMPAPEMPSAKSPPIQSCVAKMLVPESSAHESPIGELPSADMPMIVVAIPAAIPADIPAAIPADIPADIPAAIPADIHAAIPAVARDVIVEPVTPVDPKSTCATVAETSSGKNNSTSGPETHDRKNGHKRAAKGAADITPPKMKKIKVSQDTRDMYDQFICHGRKFKRQPKNSVPPEFVRIGRFYCSYKSFLDSLMPRHYLSSEVMNVWIEKFNREAKIIGDSNPRAKKKFS